jgi:hypothetical protein
MSTWNASNYRQRKSARLASVKAEWVTNPDTGEQFYLRDARSSMSSVLNGYMPSALTNTAVEAWKAIGVAGLEDVANGGDVAAFVKTLTPDQIDVANRSMARLSMIIQQACVIPLLSNEDPDKIEFNPEWIAAAKQGLAEKDPEFGAATFAPKDLVLDPRDFDDKDSAFLFKWASGLVGTVGVKGGGAMKRDDLTRFRKKPGRRARAGHAGKGVRQAS